MAKNFLLLFLTFGLFACGQKIDAPPILTSSHEKPNVMIIMTDDQGWGDVGFNGNEQINTAELDQLRKSGILFDQFQVSPVCSPTRASVLTGRHSLRTGVWSVTRGGEKMRTEEVTIAEILRDNGYRTGLFGKWHNGSQPPFTPTYQGFEEFFGFTDGHVTRYFDDYAIQNETEVGYSGYLPDVITERAIDFIKKEREEPFFALISYNTPHSPFELPEALFENYRTRGLSALDSSVYGMAENISSNIGRLQHTLDERGLDKNTIVVFLSDNGPAFPGGQNRFNGGMKGHKGKVDMGGVRVPLILSWPEKIQPNTTSSVPAQHIDLLPTLLDMLGIYIELNEIDGVSLSKAALEPQSNWIPPDRMLFTHHFRNTQRPEENPIKYGPGSVRNNNWYATVDENKSWALYDLEDDPTQSNNLASTEQTRLAKLESAYSEWFSDVSKNAHQLLSVPISHLPATITLPAHEAHIVGQSMDYGNKAGWSQDWLVSTGIMGGKSFWPISVERSVEKTVTIEYATPLGPLPAGAFSISTDISSPSGSPALKQFTPNIDRGVRKFETGEASVLTWSKVELPINIPEGSNQIELYFDKNISSGAIMIKSIIISP